MTNPPQTQLNLISTLLIASLVDNETNWPMLPKVFTTVIVINSGVENGKTAVSLKHTAFINDAFDADEDCRHTVKTG